MSTRVLVTGGSGFLGSHVAAALVSTHWMGMSMARTFDAPSEHRAARIQVERVDETAPPAMDAIPGQTAVAG